MHRRVVSNIGKAQQYARCRSRLYSWRLEQVAGCKILHKVICFITIHLRSALYRVADLFMKSYNNRNFEGKRNAEITLLYGFIYFGAGTGKDNTLAEG